RSLEARKIGLPLLEECADRLLDLGRGEPFSECGAFEAHPIEKVFLCAMTQQALGLAQCFGRLGEEGGDYLAQRLDQRSRLSTMTDQADLDGLIDSERFTQQQVPRRSPPPGKPR